jgi:hypothetical protein
MNRRDNPGSRSRKQLIGVEGQQQVAVDERIAVCRFGGVTIAQFAKARPVIVHSEINGIERFLGL